MKGMWVKKSLREENEWIVEKNEKHKLLMLEEGW